MPDVGSTDGSYVYWQKKYADLQDDYDQQSKSKDKAQKEEIDRLETANTKELRRLEKDHSEILDNVRNEAEQAYQRQKDDQQQQIEQFKAKTYNRYGRFTNEDGDTLRSQINQLQRDYETQEKQHTKQLTHLEDHLSQRAEENFQKQAENNERALKMNKQVNDQLYESTVRDQKEAYNRAAQEQRHRVEELNRLNAEELNLQRQRYQEAQKTLERDNRNLKDHDEYAQEVRAQEQERTRQKRTEETTRTMRDSHEKETKDLRRTIQELSYRGSDYSKGRAEGRQEAIHEYENETRQKERDLINTYEDELSQLSYRTKDAEDKILDRANESAIKKDAYYTKVFHDKEQKHQNEIADVRKSFKVDADALLSRTQKQIERSDAYHQQQMENATRRQNEALEIQANNFHEAEGRQREQYSNQVDRLQKELLYKNTSPNIDSVSPAAEESLRKQFAQEQHQIETVRHERDQEALDHFKREYGKRLDEAIDDKHRAQYEMRRELASEKNRDLAIYNTSISEMDAASKDRVKTLEAEHQRNTDLRDRNYATEMALMRKNYEQVLEEMHDDHRHEIESLRQDFNFKERLTQREHAGKINELTRAHERALSDQKAQFEQEINDLRMSLQNQAREHDKSTRKLFEEQLHVNEQRIAQLEQQHKERERALTQNYEVELDKVKRSNALILQKKG